MGLVESANCLSAIDGVHCEPGAQWEHLWIVVLFSLFIFTVHWRGSCLSCFFHHYSFVWTLLHRPLAHVVGRYTCWALREQPL